MFVLAALAWLLGFSGAALMIATGNLLAFTLAIWLAWRKFGRDILPTAVAFDRTLIVQKLKLYGRLLSEKSHPIGFEQSEENRISQD